MRRSKTPPGMRRSRMSPENRPSKPPPGMRGGNAGAGARRRERGTKCGRGPGGRSRRQNPPPKAWGRMWGAGLGRSTGPGYAARNTGRSARPERTARNTGPECEPGCGGRCARTGVRARSARAVPPGTRGRSVGPECEPGCGGRSARPTQGGMRGAGARGPGCEGRNTGPERGDRSLSPERESLLPKSALQIRHPKRGAECGGRSGSERETGVHRPEHGTGVRAGVRRQECGGRSAETGVRGPDARTGAREPECEPGCGGRSARPGAGAGVRGRVRTQNLR